MKHYYALTQNETQAHISIYGDITSWPWLESDVSAYLLSKQIGEIQADVINLYINSYGGEVSEALAIYNALKRHPAKVITHCDGFACSAASIVFMAGEERLMNEASLLMIHNVWTSASGNAEEFRKAAADLDIITAATTAAYKSAVGISDAELVALMDAETWIPARDAVAMGFATGLEAQELSGKASASARSLLLARLLTPVAKTTKKEATNPIKFLEALMR